METIELKRDEYHWGTVRKIVVGHSITVMIDSQDWIEIQGVMTGRLKGYVYRDETGVHWGVRRVGELKIRFDELTGKCYGKGILVNKSEMELKFS